MTRKEIDNRIKENEKKRKIQERELNRLSNFRLVLAIFFVLSLASYFKEGMTAGLVMAGIDALLFAYMVVLFGRKKEDIEALETYKVVLERYKERLLGTWENLPETGAAYRDWARNKSDDLDLFGARSLFQYLSVAHTMSGNDALARLLVKPNLTYISDRQNSVAELLRDDDFALQFEALALQPNERKRKREQEAEKSLRSYARGEGEPVWPYLQWVGYALPLVTALAIGATVAGALPITIPLSLVATQLGAAILAGGAIAERKRSLINFHRRLKGLQSRLTLLQKMSFESYYLTQMQQDIANSTAALADLNRLVSLWNLRENFLMYFPLCGLFAWDFNCLAAIERWRKRYGDDFNLWLDWIGEVEALLSLGTIGRVREDAVLAEIVDLDRPYLDMEEATHPLLASKTAVRNDYHQEGETVIITGSNMSGKSTFMRTIGLNAVLAYAGGVVCAKRFVISPMHVLTSMRVRDDVGQGISTFYGEILRIKEMADYAKKQRPMLVLIDEIFKGTNSADRIIGAETAIRRLSKPWIMTLVTTHDFELCALVEAQEVNGRNHHFEEHYEGDDILFDYKIRPGRCQTTNAQALMRMAGLMDDVDDEDR